MSNCRLLLCADMDRTVIPNGVQSEHGHARKRFRDFCQRPEVTLVYVTGRHQGLVREALKNYRLPAPDYLITDVGSKIYHAEDDTWIEHRSWEQEIDPDWNGHSREQIQDLLSDIKELSRQEPGKQNTHKASYYLHLYSNKDRVIAEVDGRLNAEGIRANLIYSIDEPKNVGLLDILPRSADKLHAICFLQQELDFALHEVLFAGDSGNDLQVLSSPIPSVLVANASDDIKDLALDLAARQGHPHALYIAQAGDLDMNGNYAAGVLAGVWHFARGFRDILQQADNTS